jgi:hypothetical protein
MSERPILMQGDMVRAILDGRKSMTRRVIKPQPPKDVNYLPDLIFYENEPYTWSSLTMEKINKNYCGEWWTAKCPYGVVGDRLWVRETWSIDEDDQPIIFYRATDHETCGNPYKSSIIMPRWASRILLEVTSVKVERVQDISEEDAEAEGAPLDRMIGYGRYGEKTHREGFIYLWHSINAKRGYGWDVNPWVWVIGFKRVP